MFVVVVDIDCGAKEFMLLPKVLFSLDTESSVFSAQKLRDFCNG
jgi:hypothetical protein